MPVMYPFSAVLGCHADALDDMGLALVLTTISPEIGGVLIRGEKGTAKSTAVRALASVLPPIDVYAADRFSVDPTEAGATSPDGPFEDADVVSRPVRLVELPVGATEDRVLGSLHLERALSHGKVEYEPGLLARAHRGILYVDEVNLLHDHLVDVLLDAAAMGRATIERDGVSIEHAARLVLIGTMNPEEGELRPQLLDRFGLTVEVAAPRDPALRSQVVRRRMAYDRDPDGFAKDYRAADTALTERIEAARSRLGEVELSDTALSVIAQICAAFEVDGLRADIVMARAALAHAAWAGRATVTKADIRQAALLALPHRRRRNPFDAPGLDEDLLDQLLNDAPPDPPQPPEGPQSPDDPQPPSTDDSPSSEPPAEGEADGEHQPPETNESTEPNEPSESSEATEPAEDDANPPNPTPASGAAPHSQVAAAYPYRPKVFHVHGLGQGSAGRRSRAIANQGRRIGSRRGSSSGSLHLVETVLAAAPKQSARGRVDGRIRLRTEDIRTAVREGREANLIVFCVDASGSMAARKRMVQVKTAVMSLLLDAYRRRDKVALVTFRGDAAEVALPPTRSVDIAATRLDDLPAGGRTPLAEGLSEAAQLILRERVRDPRLRPLLIVVTDGRATNGRDAVARSREVAARVADLKVSTVVIDGETGPLRLGLAATLADLLGAQHVPVTDVTAEALTDTVSAQVKGAA